VQNRARLGKDINSSTPTPTTQIHGADHREAGAVPILAIAQARLRNWRPCRSRANLALFPREEAASSTWAADRCGRVNRTDVADRPERLFRAITAVTLALDAMTNVFAR